MRRNRVEMGIQILAALLVAGPLAAGQAPDAEAKIGEAVDAVIRTSPRYGPFDIISYQVKGDTVTLGGAVYRAPLKEETEKAVAAIAGVGQVVSSIEILPLSKSDDQLRHAVFNRIYRDSFLSKYGTPAATLGGGGWDRGHGPGSPEPPGKYAIHVVVKGGRVTLYGRVDNDVDRNRAESDARNVFGVMGVENRLEVNERKPAS